MSMLEPLPWGLGVIEGFYGRAWGEADRIDTLRFLASTGYRYYVYAPKSDAVLRRAWRDRWPAAVESHLLRVADAARAAGLTWGVGLSPLGLVEDMGSASLGALRSKVAYLDSLGVQLLCVLFDDMPRGVDDLAERQCAAVAEIASVSRARHLLVCPSYYTRDPVLERLFGARPPRYWADLGRGLPREAGIFWTGEKVCSSAYDAAELDDIGAQLGRAPVLWDNYPVNDGARMADFLHIDAFRGRAALLSRHTAGHFANPMNQCWLSRIPLATLPRVYSEDGAYDPQRAFEEAAMMLAGEAGLRLAAERESFQVRGLKQLGAAERAVLETRYSAIDAPWAREIVDWLGGGYAFDPACLTD